MRLNPKSSWMRVGSSGSRLTLSHSWDNEALSESAESRRRCETSIPAESVRCPGKWVPTENALPLKKWPEESMVVLKKRARLVSWPSRPKLPSSVSVQSSKGSACAVAVQMDCDTETGSRIPM